MTLNHICIGMNHDHSNIQPNILNTQRAGYHQPALSLLLKSILFEAYFLSGVSSMGEKDTVGRIALGNGPLSMKEETISRTIPYKID